jgi:hypothetical protein
MLLPFVVLSIYFIISISVRNPRWPPLQDIVLLFDKIEIIFVPVGNPRWPPPEDLVLLFDHIEIKFNYYSLQLLPINYLRSFLFLM